VPEKGPIHLIRLSLSSSFILQTFACLCACVRELAVKERQKGKGLVAIRLRLKGVRWTVVSCGQIDTWRWWLNAKSCSCCVSLSAATGIFPQLSTAPIHGPTTNSLCTHKQQQQPPPRRESEFLAAFLLLNFPLLHTSPLPLDL
jgi:hypothetical protein